MPWGPGRFNHQTIKSWFPRLSQFCADSVGGPPGETWSAGVWSVNPGPKLRPILAREETKGLHKVIEGFQEAFWGWGPLMPPIAIIKIARHCYGLCTQYYGNKVLASEPATFDHKPSQDSHWFLTCFALCWPAHPPTAGT